MAEIMVPEYERYGVEQEDVEFIARDVDYSRSGMVETPEAGPAQVGVGDIPPPSRAQLGLEDEYGNPMVDGKRYSPNVRSQQTGELVELPEGVNRFEYSTPGPHPPSKGYYFDEGWEEEERARFSPVPSAEAEEGGRQDVRQGVGQTGEQRMPSREEVRQKFFQQWGNPFTMAPRQTAKVLLEQDLPALHRQFFRGAIPWGGKMNADQKKQWDKFLDEIGAEYENREIEKQKMLQDAYGDVMGHYDKVVAQNRAEQDREEKRRAKANEMEVFRQKEYMKREIDIEMKEKAAARARRLKASGIQPGKPLDANQQRQLDNDVRNAEQDLLQYPKEVWNRTNVKYVNENNPTRTRMWIWHNNRASEVYLEDPNGKPFTYAEFLKYKEANDATNVSDVDVLRHMKLID